MEVAVKWGLEIGLTLTLTLSWRVRVRVRVSLTLTLTLTLCWDDRWTPFHQEFIRPPESQQRLSVCECKVCVCACVNVCVSGGM